MWRPLCSRSVRQPTPFRLSVLISALLVCAVPTLQGINTVSIDNWLGIIPQIIARIHTPHSSVRKLLHELLSKIGKAHPQALVYPLTVASKSQSVARKHAASVILSGMRHHSPVLVEQAMLVSQELVRVVCVGM
jgi:FKBP12-rapamycin complex-associated protein